jgi:hypothetical protein
MFSRNPGIYSKIFGKIVSSNFSEIGPYLLSAGAIAFVLLILLMILVLAIYIYISFAFMAIAKKAKFKPAGIAWIPFIGPLIITSQIAKMPWWPILFVFGFGIPFVGWCFEIALTVFATIWLWKTFEKIKIPNWFALLCLIPVVNLVILGIAAWSKKR